MMELKTIPASALPAVDPRGAASLKAGAKANDPASIKKVAQQFEAMFVGMMLKSMRETVGQDKLTGGGRGEETFRSLLDQQYADQAARTGSIGLAKMIEGELTRGSQPAPAATKGESNAN